MEWFRNKWHRLILAAFTGVLVATFVGGASWLRVGNTPRLFAEDTVCLSAGDTSCFSAEGSFAPALAWWGVIYPEFCFAKTNSETSEESKGGEPVSLAGKSLKISFWLAKALDW